MLELSVGRACRACRGFGAFAALALSMTAIGALVAQPAAALAATGGTAQAPSSEAVRTAAQANDVQAGLVTAEDDRIIVIRQALSRTPTAPDGTLPAFRVTSDARSTLVLTPRRLPYTMVALARYVPQTLVQLPDKSYLLRQNLVVARGATLAVGGAGPVTLRLQSDAGAFTSIVGLGGLLQFQGSATGPVTISSWNTQLAAPDRDLSDGRAYVRAIGGTLLLTHVAAADLGFWSGRTGGIAFTGTNRPHAVATGARVQSRTARVARRAAAAAAKNGIPATPAPTVRTTATPATATPPTAEVADSTFAGNAFGIFISDAQGLRIRDSTVSASVSDGVVLHHFVSNAVLEQVTSQGNRGNGFVLSRGVAGAVLRGDIAASNGRDGFSIAGRPLSAGPSTAGHSSTVYGDNALLEGAATDNGRAGVDILSGKSVTVHAMQLSKNAAGIIVRLGAVGVVLSNNTLKATRGDGISLREGTNADVSGNTVDGARNGIVVNNSRATVGKNTVTGVIHHGVSFVGVAARSSATGNTLTGHGSVAIDLSRASDPDQITLSDNDSKGWTTVRHPKSWLHRVLHPMNIAWAVLLLISLTGTFFARRGLRRVSAGTHPYAATRPLTSAVRLPSPRTAAADGTDIQVALAAGSPLATG